MCRRWQGVHPWPLQRWFHRSGALPDFHNRLTDAERRERLRVTVKLYIIVSGGARTCGGPARPHRHLGRQLHVTEAP